MATKMYQRRKPFGSVDGNARVTDQRLSGEDDVRKSKSKSGARVVTSSMPLRATKMTQGNRETNSINQKIDIKTEQRRDSKTPKMSNLSATGGAYDVRYLHDFCKQRGEGGEGGDKREPSKNSSQQGLDPSPLKLPDPIASFSSNKPPPKSKSQRQNSKSKPGDRDGANRFVADSLKRLFPSETHSKDKQSAKSLVSTRLGSAKVAHYVSNFPTKQDPTAKDEVEEASGIDGNELLDTSREKSRINLLQNGANAIASFNIQPPRNEHTQPIRMQQDHDQPATTELHEILDKARRGPTDNKRVLDAMLSSGCGRRTLGPDPTVNGASVLESFAIGSIVGGTSLKISSSADESEVTTLDYAYDSSQASMTTCFDHDVSSRDEIVAPHQATSDIKPSIARRQTKGAMTSIFRISAPPPPPPASQPMSSYQEITRASAITDPRQPNEQNTRQVFQPFLPAGWRERWSNTKQKPYWVHPDFGSTWHCPGLIINDKDETNRRNTSNGNMSQSTIPAESSSTNVRFRGDNAIQIRHAPCRIEPFTEDEPETLTSRANEYETYSGRARQSCIASSAQVSGWNIDENTKDNNFNQDPNHGQTNHAPKCHDGSSADVSSICLTQEFDTQRDGSTFNENETKVVNGNGNDEVEYGHDYDSLGEVKGEDDGVDAKLDKTECDDVEGLILDTIADEQSEISSDQGIQVNAVVRHGRSRYASPLKTINEFHRGSEIHRGSACQSSEVSLDDDTSLDGGLHGSNVKQISSSMPSFEDCVASGSDDRSAPVDVIGNFDFDKAEMSPDNWESSNRGGFDSDEYDLDAAPMKKSKTIPSPRRGRKKKSFFPPGPLCSLQFLQEIENKEFDTPLWRRMKRKRSTLSSVKAQKSRQRQKKHRNTMS